MSSNQSLFPFAAWGLTAFVLVAAIFVSSDFAAADPIPGQTTAQSCSSPDAQGPGAQETSKPEFTRLPALVPGALDLSDEIATLESVRFALTEVPDGASYVWHRRNGRLSGMVKPVSSFKNTTGSVCRHIVVVLSSFIDTKKAEGVACRDPAGVWQLEG